MAFRIRQTDKYLAESKKVRIRYEKPGGAKETYRFRRDSLSVQMWAGQVALVDELRREGLPNIHRYEKAREQLDKGGSDPLLRYQWHTLVLTPAKLG